MKAVSPPSVGNSTAEGADKNPLSICRTILAGQQSCLMGAAVLVLGHDVMCTQMQGHQGSWLSAVQ